MWSEKPRLLVVALKANSLDEPLVRALEQVGFDLASVPPKARGRVFGIPIPTGVGMSELAVEAAIRDFVPAMILPLDGSAARLLRDLHRKHAARAGELSARIASTVENSLGIASHYPLFANPAELSRFVRGQNVPALNIVEVDSEPALRALLQSVPLPVMMYASPPEPEFVGGPVTGVDAGIAAYRRLTGLVGRARQVLAGRSGPALLARSRRAVLVRQYAEGSWACRLVVCRAGRVLAGISMLPPENDRARPRAPATPTDHAAMDRFAALLVKRLGLSGFVGFNFVLEADGRALLVEIVPRVSHLSCLGADGVRDLAEALHRSVVTPVDRRRVPPDAHIVAFPARRKSGVEGESYPAPLRDLIMKPHDVSAIGRARPGRDATAGKG